MISRRVFPTALSLIPIISAASETFVLIIFIARELVGINVVLAYSMTWAMYCPLIPAISVIYEVAQQTRMWEDILRVLYMKK
jgi:hypothetical protein